MNKENIISNIIRYFCLLCVLIIGLTTIIASNGGGGGGNGKKSNNGTLYQYEYDVSGNLENIIKEGDCDCDFSNGKCSLQYNGLGQLIEECIIGDRPSPCADTRFSFNKLGQTSAIEYAGTCDCEEYTGGPGQTVCDAIRDSSGKIIRACACGDPEDLFSNEYVDDDGDGYNEKQGDCDDNDSNVNPDATEICNDKIDNDCDGDIDCHESLSSPGGKFTRGLAFDGINLWVVDALYEKIYNIDTTGDILDSFDSPGNDPMGLTYDGSNLWVVDNLDNTIYQIDTDGVVLSSFSSPGDSPSGLTFDGTHLWLSDAYNSKIYQIDKVGNIISSFDAPDLNPRGLAYDGTYLWNSNRRTADNSNDKLFKLDTSGKIITSYDLPYNEPAGLTYDGANIWYSGFNVDKIYKLNLSYLE